MSNIEKENIYSYIGKRITEDSEMTFGSGIWGEEEDTGMFGAGVIKQLKKRWQEMKSEMSKEELEDLEKNIPLMTPIEIEAFKLYYMIGSDKSGWVVWEKDGEVKELEDIDWKSARFWCNHNKKRWEEMKNNPKNKKRKEMFLEMLEQFNKEKE